MTGETVVVAIGGNSLIEDSANTAFANQYLTAQVVCAQIADIVERGWRVVVTHGNGPQVGFELRRSELSRVELPPVPLEFCVADTQGSIGYLLQQNLYNEFRKRSIDKSVVTLVTQVVIDADDPAFRHPTKPIGAMMTEAEAVAHARSEGWPVMADAGRGWRRVVPSPLPHSVLEANAVAHLLQAGIVVIAVGGGGIPVVRDGTGTVRGVSAVVDKDHASAVLATSLNAHILVLSTSVERIALNFGKPDEQWLDRTTAVQLRQYLAEGHFAAGSMKPKVEATLAFLAKGGREAIITDLANLAAALRGERGTHVVRQGPNP